MLFRMSFPKHDLRTTIINIYRGQGKRGEHEIHINILKSGSIQLQGTKSGSPETGVVMYAFSKH